MNPLRRKLTEAIAMTGMRPPLRVPTTPRVNLRGKRVLITGASSGIGEAGAEPFAEHGAEGLLVAPRARLLHAGTPRAAPPRGSPAGG
ncbi:MAG: short-chain dehydrogenase, partial [Mycobacterium sp.]|nr:short-chain dehydrogenase [Mycobacterium sp.]